MESNSKSYIPLDILLRPLLISMKLFGVYHDGPRSRCSVSACSENEDTNKDRRRFSNICRRIYTMSVMLFNTMNVLRAIPSVWVGYSFTATGTIYKVLFLSWYLLCTLHCLTMYRMFEKKKHFQAAIEYYNAMVDDTVSPEYHIRAECFRMKRIVIKVTIAAWGSLILNWIASAFFLFSDMVPDLMSSLVNPFPSSIVFKALVQITMIYSSAAWVLPIAFSITLFYIVKIQFLQFKQTFGKILKDNKIHTISLLKKYRLKHLQICKLANIFEKDIQYLLLFVFVVEIFIACFLLYAILKTQSQTLTEIISLSIFLVLHFLVVIILSVMAAQVNMQAHAPLEDVYEIDLTDATQEEIGELRLFLSKLTGERIGFSAMGLVTVTKELILTLGSIYLTYFFLLLQF